MIIELIEYILELYKILKLYKINRTLEFIQ